jgi:hypothetical protein
MENVKFVKILGDPDYEEIPENIILKDANSGKIYIGDIDIKANEIKTEKSNNWAKTFFYGGS